MNPLAQPTILTAVIIPPVTDSLVAQSNGHPTTRLFDPTAMLPADSAPPPAIIAVVTIPTPRFAPDWFVARRMRSTLPQYAAAAGLRWKAYTLMSEPRRFGGIYEWQDRAAADRWFDPAWFERIRTSYRPGGGVRFLEVLAAVDAAALPTNANERQDGVAYLQDVAATAEVTSVARVITEACRSAHGLLFARLLRADDGRRQLLTVWSSDVDAAAGHRRCAEATGVSSAIVEQFRVPVLLPPAAMGQAPRS